jgi:hypothetical protein
VKSRNPTRLPWRWTVAALGVVAAMSCADDPTAVVPPCGEAAELVPGETVTGTLGPGTARRGGSYIQHYTVWPVDSMDVLIVMSSAAVEPFLLLFDEAGRVIDQAMGEPVPGGGHTAVLERRIGACHTIGATTWAPDSRGRYALRLVGGAAATLDARFPQAALVSVLHLGR